MGNAHAPLSAIVEANKDEVSDYSQAPYWNDKPDAEAIIRYSKKGPSSREMGPAMTVIELFNRAAQKRANSMALLQEPPALIALIDGKKAPPPVPREQWRTWTWSQYLKDVRKTARAMMALGFVQHDACTIFGFVRFIYLTVLDHLN